MVTWVAARHVVFVVTIWSLYEHSDTVSPIGCCRGKTGSVKGPLPIPHGYSYLLEPFSGPEGFVCWTPAVRWGFLIALFFLQVLQLVWFCMIVTAALGVLQGSQADDVRSDDEEENDVSTAEKVEFIEKVVKVQPFEKGGGWC